MSEHALPNLWEVDLEQVESAVLRRLIAELREEQEAARPWAYDRIHQRYNRDSGPYDRVHNRHNRGR